MTVSWLFPREYILDDESVIYWDLLQIANILYNTATHSMPSYHHEVTDILNIPSILLLLFKQYISKMGHVLFCGQYLTPTFCLVMVSLYYHNSTAMFQFHIPTKLFSAYDKQFSGNILTANVMNLYLYITHLLNINFTWFLLLAYQYFTHN